MKPSEVLGVYSMFHTWYQRHAQGLQHTGVLKAHSSAVPSVAHVACLLIAMCSTAGGTRRAVSARGPCWG